MLVDRKSLYVHIVHLGATKKSPKTISKAVKRLRSNHTQCDFR